MTDFCEDYESNHEQNPVKLVENDYLVSLYRETTRSSLSIRIKAVSTAQAQRIAENEMSGWDIIACKKV